MKLGILSHMAMFLSSYVFLFLALALKFYTSRLLWVLFIISLIGLLGAFIILKMKINPDEGIVKRISQRNELVASYLVTYVVPFLSFSFGTVNEQISMLVFFFLIGILYIKANLIYINPTLMLFGYNIFEVTFSNERTRILISTKTLQEIMLEENIRFYELYDRAIIVHNTLEVEDEEI